MIALAQSSFFALWGWNHGQHQGSSQSTAGGALCAFKIQVEFSDALYLQECQLTRASITEKVCALQLPTEKDEVLQELETMHSKLGGSGSRAWAENLVGSTDPGHVPWMLLHCMSLCTIVQVFFLTFTILCTCFA